MYHIGLQVLRAKIRGFQVASETLGRRAKQSSGDKRHRYHLMQRDLGAKCRLHLIAYGLLRSISYERIEKCDANNPPDAKRIHELMQEHADWRQRQALTLPSVTSMLTTSSTESSPSPACTLPQPEKQGLLERARALLENGASP